MSKEIKKNSILLGIIQCINVFGDDFLNVAIMWIIYADTRSAIISGIAGIVWQLSDALIAPIAGLIADKYSKKKIVILSNFIAFICSVSVTLFIIINKNLPIIYAIITLCIFNILTAFVTPCRKVIISTMIDKSELEKINGIFASITKISSVISSSISSYILYLGGIALSFLMNSISYMLVIIGFMIFNWKIVEINNNFEEKKDDKKISVNIKDSFNFIKSNSILKSIFIICFLVNIASFIGTYMSAIVFENFGNHPEIYGIIQSMAMIGAILGSLMMSSGKINGKKTLALNIMLMGIAICIFGKSQIIIISFLSITIFYTLQSIISICIETIIMKYIDLKYIGRVSGLLTTFSMICIPISTAIAGIIGEIMSVQMIFIFAGLYLVIVGIYLRKIINNLQ